MFISVRTYRRKAREILWPIVLMILIGLTGSLPKTVVAEVQSVSIIAPDDGEILDGLVTLQANVAHDTPLDSVEFFYDPHEDDEPEITSSPPPTSSSPRFIFPAESEKSRSPATFSAIQSTAAPVSPWVKPTRRQKPRSIAPATRPPIVTDALETRWRITRMLRLPK